MPESTSIFDDIDDEAEAAAIAEAEADRAAGRLVPHEEVMRWVESWFTPNELCYPGEN